MSNLVILLDISRVDNAFLVSLVGLRPEKHFWLGLSNQKNVEVFAWTNTNSVRFTHWNAQMPGIERFELPSVRVWEWFHKWQLTISLLTKTRPPTGLCCNGNWEFCWPLGCAALYQQREVYLQTPGRGSSFNPCSTDSSTPQVCRRLECRVIKTHVL